MSEWQTIETAPKYPLNARGHGPSILAFGLGIEGFPAAWDVNTPRTPEVAVIYWVELNCEKHVPAGEIDGRTVYKKETKKSCEYWGPHSDQFRPTHWMLLPDPPVMAK